MSAAKGSRLRREERREHFLDVAADLVVERGVEAVTMEAIAAAAGVSKGLGYAYFGNRSEVLLAVLQREMDAYGERISRGLADADDLEGKIRAGVRAFFDLVAERGHLLGVLLSATQIQGPLQESQTTMNRQAEVFYGDLAVRELGVPRREALSAAAILLAGLTGALDRWVQGGESRDLLEETYVRLALGGLRALVPAGAATGPG